MSTRTTLTALAIAVAALLAACGGGEDLEEDGRAAPQPVDCKADPQACV